VLSALSRAFLGSDVDHYPVEHWLLGRSRITGRWMAAFDEPCGSCLQRTRDSRSPSCTDQSLRKRSELSLFRFEGVTLWVVPGDVPSVLV